MEGGTKLSPGEEPSASDNIHVQPLVTTQPLCTGGGGPSVPASAKEEDEECEKNKSLAKQSSNVSVGNWGPDGLTGGRQNDSLQIHAAYTRHTDKADNTSLDCFDSEGSSEQERCFLGPTPEVGHSLDAPSLDSATFGDTIDDDLAAYKKKTEERVGPRVSVPEVKDTEPNMTHLVLLGLPNDALHAIASFLSPNDFCNFGLGSKYAMKVCRDVFRRVRMHGFLCATEVATAWTLNQHADAKELCALYIGAGVPIYPTSLGHSYHTMVWRMGIEAKEMENSSINPNAESTERDDNRNNVELSSREPDTTSTAPVDRFFAERYDSRAREGFNFALSYLEEKSLFMLNSEKHSVEASGFAQRVRRQMYLGPHPLSLQPPHNNGHANMEDGHVYGLHRARVQMQDHASQLLRLQPTGFSRRGLTRSTSYSDLRGHSSKVLVKVHRHLLDQHLLGRSSVDDKDGSMTTPPVNLSADFFHPHFNVFPRNELLQQEATQKYEPSSSPVAGERRPEWIQSFVPSQHTVDGDLNADPVAGMNGGQLTLVDTTDDSDSDGELPNHEVLHTAETIFEPPAAVLATAGHQRRASPMRPQELSAKPYPLPLYPNILLNVDLEVYSASSAKKKIDVEQEDREIRHHLFTRFATYQRRLEHLLSQFDSHGFDECMLDFWDEFLPQTANIQYYDRNTAVPRISCLGNFLTRPCPKALGIVQCEIERIKLGQKKKGVNMKGRLFPTYEYRLFIRHRPPGAIDGGEQPRRDTVLMVAKNRGRKHVESSASSATVKKGANNYFLYIPQQEDVEQHFGSVNGIDLLAESVTNGPSRRPMPPDGPALMGRLQSNFIGTEFQIFVPQVVKKDQFMKNRPMMTHARPFNAGLNTVSVTEDEYGYDSGVSSDNPSATRRKSRFGRLSLRRNGAGHPPEPSPIAEENSPVRPLRRSRSSGDMAEGNRRARTSRRAIANNSEGFDVQFSQTALLEEEDGAITYTANLLGSRPRIMDVCIPRVSPDGVPGAEWKRYLDRCMRDFESGAGNRMLNHLKQIQQRLDNDELGVVRSNQEGVDIRDINNTDEYSPPDDFGLLALQNRPPWWNIELGSFVLNFGGRVSVASVKNFQLCDRVDQDYIMLQFGRIQGRHSFTMDFRHPLTAVQAFAIAISSLQSKISFG